MVAVLAKILGTFTLCDGTSKEAFTAFARKGVVVVSRGSVTTDQAELFLGPLARSLVAAHAARGCLAILLPVGRGAATDAVAVGHDGSAGGG